MRFYLIWMAFLFMSAYAWKDWTKSLCFLVFSMALLERPDMPKAMLGIPGFNPWNILFFSIVGSFLLQYSKTQDAVKLPNNIKFYLFFYLFFILLAFFREVGDLQGINRFIEYVNGRNFVTPKGVFIDDIVNTLKYAIPGVLCFFAADSKKNLRWLYAAILMMIFLLALQVVKVMPIGALTDGKMLEQTGIRKIDRDIGYYRSDLAILFGGGAWALYLIRPLVNSFWISLFCLSGSFLTVLAMALTGGRIGMGGWVVVGVLIAYYRVRKLLILGPLIAVLVVSFVPAVQERFLQGFEGNEDSDEADSSSVTSGRSDIWPVVIEKIGEAPFFGYGRRAMQRIGLSQWLGENLGKPFPHPHNAYMEMLLDNGIVLSLPILVFFFVLLKYSFSLFRDKRNEIYIICGGVAFTLLFSQMVGFLGSQSFYPFTSSTPMWCSLGIMVRIYYERSKIDPKDIDAHQKLYTV